MYKNQLCFEKESLINLNIDVAMCLFVIVEILKDQCFDLSSHKEIVNKRISLIDV